MYQKVIIIQKIDGVDADEAFLWSSDTQFGISLHLGSDSGEIPFEIQHVFYSIVQFLIRYFISCKYIDLYPT